MNRHRSDARFYPCLSGTRLSGPAAQGALLHARLRSFFPLLAYVGSLALWACAEVAIGEDHDGGKRPAPNPLAVTDGGMLDAAGGDAMTGGPGATVYLPCSGPPYGRGTCARNEICAAMPRVDYKYCIPRAPCPGDMVEVANVGCAHPCEQASDCVSHGLSQCGPNDLADLTGGAPGWCTP